MVWKKVLERKKARSPVDIVKSYQSGKRKVHLVHFKRDKRPWMVTGDKGVKICKNKKLCEAFIKKKIGIN